MLRQVDPNASKRRLQGNRKMLSQPKFVLDVIRKAAAAVMEKTEG
jgi:hypothetical protein